MQRNTANTYFNFFGNTINDIRCKPTSREFISAVVDKILLENKELDKLKSQKSDLATEIANLEKEYREMNSQITQKQNELKFEELL